MRRWSFVRLNSWRHTTGLILAIVAILLAGDRATAQTVDFAIEVMTGPAASLLAKDKVYIDNGVAASITADQKWYVVGACSNKPNASIYIDKSVTGSLTADI
jgi:hypothetical protein